MAELVSVSGYFLYGRNDPELTWPIEATPGQLVLLMVVTGTPDDFHVLGEWENLIDPGYPQATVGDLGSGWVLASPLRWVGDSVPSEVTVTVDGYADANVYILVMQLGEGESIGAWHYGNSDQLAPGSKVELNGAPEANAQVFALGQVFWTSPA